MTLDLNQVRLVVDIDGVIADSSAREAAALEVDPTRGKAFWEAFLDPEKVQLDTLVPGAARLIGRFRANGAEVVYLTSRPETMEDATKVWMRANSSLLFAVGFIFKPAALKFCKTVHFKASVLLGLSQATYRTIVFIDDEAANREVFESIFPGYGCYESLAAFQDARGGVKPE